MKCKCKHCHEFVNKEDGIKTPAGFFCCFDHAIKFANEKTRKTAERNAAKARRELDDKERQARKAHKERLVEVRPIYWHRERAKRAFQNYRRIFLIAEYLNAGEAPRCESCGTTQTIQWQAGHYRPAGVNSALMFDESNVWLQCKCCNEDRAGNLTLYRNSLVIRLGEAAVKALDNNHEIKRWTREELTEITETYRFKLKELQKLECAA